MKATTKLSPAAVVHLNCPRCGLTIAPRTKWLTISHCPRCLGRDRIAVELFSSALPVDELYADGAGPQPLGAPTARSPKRCL
jgi:hypothetical protein